MSGGTMSPMAVSSRQRKQYLIRTPAEISTARAPNKGKNDSTIPTSDTTTISDIAGQVKGYLKMA